MAFLPHLGEGDHAERGGEGGEVVDNEALSFRTSQPTAARPSPPASGWSPSPSRERKEAQPGED